MRVSLNVCGLSVGLQLLSRLVNFVFNLLTLRRLGPEDNGVWDTVACGFLQSALRRKLHLISLLFFAPIFVQESE